MIVEIRGGAGGEEGGLFAGDLFRMLSRYAERRGFATEELSVADGDYTFAVKGDGAYSVFKHEGGTHRVQRVPETESQGRIHTSTATVAVLPEAEDVEVQVNDNDLQIDVYRSSGPGGQSVNTTDSAVRITHKPTGLVVSMQDEKSQLQNRERAMRVLRARLYEQELAAQQAEQAQDRRAQVGTGERSEKIRTYNFPQDRVTDHRVKLTKGEVARVLGGELDEFTNAPRQRRSASSWKTPRSRPLSEGLRRTRRSGRRPAAAGCDTPDLDAEVLIADAMGVDRGALVADREQPIVPAAARLVGERIRRRVQREPVAYILGRKGFRFVELAVDARVLIPRPETELWRSWRWRCPTARRCTTWAPAAGRWRWRWPPSGPASASAPPTPRPRRWWWRAPTRLGWGSMCRSRTDRDCPPAPMTWWWPTCPTFPRPSTHGWRRRFGSSSRVARWCPAPTAWTPSGPWCGRHRPAPGSRWSTAPSRGSRARVAGRRRDPKRPAGHERATAGEVP